MRYWITLFFTFFILDLQAQLLIDKEFYPGVGAVKTKSYNGTGGGGYWSLEVLDSLGRPVINKRYNRRKLLSKIFYQYNSHHDKILEVQVFDINNPGSLDSAFTKYEYSQSNRIIRQSRRDAQNDSIVYELMENKGDSVLTYKQSSFYYRPQKRKTDESVSYYTFTYNLNEELIKLKTEDLNNDQVEIKHFGYFNNGKLRSIRIERYPEPENEIVYMGGPGSDDMRYEYKYDRKGRVKKLYAIVKGRKYKLAKYEYKEA